VVGVRSGLGADDDLADADLLIDSVAVLLRT
jgi:hypothetical protein